MKKTNASSQIRLDAYFRRSNILFAIIPMFLVLLISMLVIAVFYEHVNRDEIGLKVDSTAKNVEQWIQDNCELALACAQEQEIVRQIQSGTSLDARGEEIIAAFLSGRGDGLQLHMLSRDGRLRYSTGSIPNLYKLPVYQDSGIFRLIAEDGVAVRTTKFMSFNRRQIVLSIGVGIQSDAGEIIGYIILDVEREKLAELLYPCDSAYISEMVITGGARDTVGYSTNLRINEGVTLKDSWLLGKIKAASTYDLSSSQVYIRTLYGGKDGTLFCGRC